MDDRDGFERGPVTLSGDAPNQRALHSRAQGRFVLGALLKASLRRATDRGQRRTNAISVSPAGALRERDRPFRLIHYAMRPLSRGASHFTSLRSSSAVVRTRRLRRDRAQSRASPQRYRGVLPNFWKAGPPPRVAIVASDASATGKPSSARATARAARLSIVSRFFASG